VSFPLPLRLCDASRLLGKLRDVTPDLIEAIDALLPQTQCAKCGYAGCGPYAQAIAAGEADINQCPPGGARVIRELAQLLGRAEKPLNAANGTEGPRSAALIDESRCIGCMLCIKACPVDAIVGAAKCMHTVLTQYCTGCELCLTPCPVDCIDMVELGTLAQQGNQHAAALAAQSSEHSATMARRRFGRHQLRVGREKAGRSERLTNKAGRFARESTPGHDRARKTALVQAAIERARARRARFSKQ
jgi:electron transport complex protein RnfB